MVTLNIKSTAVSSKVTLGTLAGNVNQQSRGVAIGYSAGQTNQGANAIAIGAYAAPENQPSNSIVLNASGNSVQTSNAGVYINPMRTLVHSSNVVVYTANELSVGTTNITVPGSMTAASFVGDGSQVTLAPKPTLTISNVQITDSSYSVLDDTAISTDNGGYCLVNGTGYTPGCIVMIGTTFASSISFVSSTQLRIQVPAKASGSYNVTVIRGDTETATLIVGITYSPFPVWSTSSTLVNVTKTVAFSQTLSATEALGSNITYSGITTLPPGTTVSSNGIFSGNITDDLGNTTVYSFSIDAIDQQLQNIPRTFSLTALNPIVVASGGTVTTSGLYTIHTFTTSGTFTISSNPVNKTVDVLLVAGGGGGGAYTKGGGGGGGGLLYQVGFGLVTSSMYTVTVGSGGAGLTYGRGGQGTNSSVSSLTAIGGGGGGGGAGTLGNGGSGGSGGGGYLFGTGGAGTSGQGYSGGSGDSSNHSGGGGGAGAGGSYTSSGGNGLQNDITGSLVYYAGGGGGASNYGGGGGGLGGGGTAGASPNGTSNTGGGGGGWNETASSSGAGGSGIVIIRYIAG